MIGMVYWQLFYDAVVVPLRQVESAHALIAKLSFPREAILLAALANCVFNFLVRLALLVVFYLYYRSVPNPVGLAAMPLVALTLLLTGFVFSVLIIPIALLFKDFTQGLSILLNLLLFVTPVGYAIDPSSAGKLFAWNPLFYLVDLGRASLITGALPHLSLVVALFGVAMLLLLLGWVIYRLSLPIIIERLTS